MAVGATGAAGSIPVVQPPTSQPSGAPPKDEQAKFWQAVGRGASHSGSVARDGIGATFGQQPLMSAVGLNSAWAAGLAYKHQEALSGLSGKLLAADAGKQFVINGIRVTPTLVSAVLGPAAADAASYLAPNIVPSYKKGMSEGDKSAVQIKRAVAGGAVIGATAGLVWLVKPNLFRSAGFISDRAVNGFTDTVVRNGQRITRTVQPMARNASFSNRMVFGIAGGGTAAVLGNRALTKDGAERRNLAIGAAAAGAATAGAMALAPRLSGLPTANLFMKPNIQWIKEYAYKIAPITAFPAGTAAFNYLDVFGAFGEVTESRSPYRKAPQ